MNRVIEFWEKLKQEIEDQERACEELDARSDTEKARPMVGLLAQLTPAQRASALAYRGPENNGPPVFISRAFDPLTKHWFDTPAVTESIPDNSTLADENNSKVL